MAHSYRALVVSQRSSEEAPTLLLFAAPAGEIVQWANVERLTVTGEGVQRRRNEAKVRAISRFLESDDRNTLPSALTVALSGVTVDQSPDGCAAVTIPDLSEGGAGLVIDGQHRLYGAESFEASTPLNVVAILNPTDLEIAFQFLVINNKASKVPTDHIRLLAISIDDQELASRLQTARMSLSKTATLVGIVDSEDDSPFYRSLIWPVDQTQPGERFDLVRPAAIEVALATISQKELVGLDNEDALIAFFFAIWGAIKAAWPELWTTDSRLLGKAGLVAMTQFLLEDLTPSIDRDRLDAASPDAVSAEVADVLNDLTPEFWSADWTMASLDTSSGRQLIVEALQKVRRNRRKGEAWFAGISLVVGSSEIDGGE
jgi:DGQHR domain-containing protein